jgi:Eco57I restriction-modification methylase
MTMQASFTLRSRNPDVLTCIANLSNDEVFTPPELANQMLDTLAKAWAADNNGADLWANKNIKFLDPCTKSGVFLREITKRLTNGLENEIPDLQKRVDHILSKQVFGIGITRLTSLLARRSVYCSKNADSEHSIAKCLKSNSGNIWYERLEHSWVNGSCKYCGASKFTLDRVVDLDNHAYAFIHSSNVKKTVAEMFGEKMQFDVIIGNPPYQMKDGGHQASATPIYQKFIDAAISLDPHYITMITPSRWFQGGRGLGEFREKMLSDMRLRTIVDFIRDKDAFPTINVNGGVSYFLWDRNQSDTCNVTTVEAGGIHGESMDRKLNEFDIFIRRNKALPILRKVHSRKERTFDKRVSSLKPFGLRTNFHGEDTKSSLCKVKLYGSGKISWIASKQIQANDSWVKEWKVLIAAATDGNENYPLPIWDQSGPFISSPGEACTETYLVASIAKSEEEAENIRSYMRTKFFRFLVSLRKVAQHNKAENFSFVPDLPMDKIWTDEELYERYEITPIEVAFIDEMIRTMDWQS